MFALIRGAGDIASGIALRLWHSGFDVMMTDLERPTCIRRTVSFCEAVVKGRTDVEDVSAQRAENITHAKELLKRNILPVFADPKCIYREALEPDILIDAILAKRNLGTKITDAPIVIGVGPGFEAGVDCHAVIETMRGHTLGRVIYQGSALPNTNVPGRIGGYEGERVLRAPCDGIFRAERQIGDTVSAGDIVGTVGDKPMVCMIGGVLRGLLADGTEAHEGMKAGDVDPRGKKEYCYTVSDKALAVAGGVLEAILHLYTDQTKPSP